MNRITLKDVLRVVQQTMDRVDNRLLNHGEQVAFLCLRMGRALGYSDAHLRDVATLALIHDIGAYKTEERLQLVEVDVHSPHEHSAYGSIFLREFSPLCSLSDVILFHHWRYEDRFVEIGGRLAPTESFMIHAADRLSVMFKIYGENVVDHVWSHMKPLAGKTFHPEFLDLLITISNETNLLEILHSGRYVDEVYDYFDRVELSSKQAAEHLSTLVYAIDFRSRQTVTHSVSVVTVADQITHLMELPEARRESCHVAALLHDVGKITTPLNILAKPGKLDDNELAVMRQHVVETENILLDAGLKEISSMASTHHECLDGSGYPHGLRAESLSVESRIIAVADRFAALIEPRYYKPALPKVDVLGILARSASSGKIDTDVYEVVRDNYDLLAAQAGIKQRFMFSLYERVTEEFGELTSQMQGKKSTVGLENAA